MISGGNNRTLILMAGTILAGISAISQSKAGSFAVDEQSTYFTGLANAGAAAGVDISSMYWNPAATAAQPGLNTSSSYYGYFISAPERATNGTLLATHLPASTDAGTDAIATSSYLTYQHTDKLYFGLAMNAPFGLTTKPDNIPWAGSSLGNTTRIFSIEAEPTFAYKLTPEITVGFGAQIEYFQVKLNNSTLTGPVPGGVVIGQRSFEGDNVGAGATAGILWQPMPGTSLGIGYRSSVDVSPGGTYARQSAYNPFLAQAVPGVLTYGTGTLTLPNEVTASFRQVLNPQFTVLGTVLWQNWSQVGNVSVTSPSCANGVCETLNLNYRDGWYFSLGAEYAYDPQWTFRLGVGYEISPVTGSNRDTLLPDANRVQIGAGASYKWSDKIVLNVAYSHVFVDDAPFCVASPTAASPATHCTSATPAGAILLQGLATPSADIVSAGLNYKFSTDKPLEPYK